MGKYMYLALFSIGTGIAGVAVGFKRYCAWKDTDEISTRMTSMSENLGQQIFSLETKLDKSAEIWTKVLRNWSENLTDVRAALTAFLRT